MAFSAQWCMPCRACCHNPHSSAYLLQAFLVVHVGKPTELVGNRTECALLQLLSKWGLDYKAIREAHHDSIEHLYGFSSAQKMASVLMRTPSGLRLYNKVGHSGALFSFKADVGPELDACCDASGWA